MECDRCGDPATSLDAWGDPICPDCAEQQAFDDYNDSRMRGDSDDYEDTESD